MDGWKFEKGAPKRKKNPDLVEKSEKGLKKRILEHYNIIREQYGAKTDGLFIAAQGVARGRHPFPQVPLPLPCFHDPGIVDMKPCGYPCRACLAAERALGTPLLQAGALLCRQLRFRVLPPRMEDGVKNLYHRLMQISRLSS